MGGKSDVRAQVLSVASSLEEHATTLPVDNHILGAALIEVGLRTVARDAKRPVSEAERKLIRAHHPDATDDDVDAHRVTPAALVHILDLLVTAARKYVDHQPEAFAALNACADDTVVERLVAAVCRHHQNAYASADAFGVSAYDVAAATITNASILASRHGVCLEQLVTIHLEAVQRALESARREYGI